MAITITVDNDRTTNPENPPFNPLVEDETKGQQTGAPGSGDGDGDEVNVTVSGGTFGGFTTAFNTFLSGLALTPENETFAAANDGAQSETDFVQVVADNGETLNSLQFVGPDGQFLNGDQVMWDDDGDPNTAKVALTTLDGQNIYLYNDGTFGSSADFAVAVTHDDNTASGTPDRIVAAFHLYGEALNVADLNTGDLISTAGVETITFEPLYHPDADNPDDAVNWSDVLRVGGSATLSFEFDDLKSGNFLWMALGNDSAGLLVTGQDLNVVDSGAKIGERVTGGSDPSDLVNTSAAGKDPSGTITNPSTIGINSQHFAAGNQGADGPVAVFTVVTGMDKLAAANINPLYPNQNFGIDVDDITYDNYINPSGGSILISQTTGSDPIKMELALWEAGGGAPASGPDDDQLTSALKPEMGYADITDPNTNEITSYGYIGNQDTDRHLNDDTPVAIGTITIGEETWNWNDTNIGTTGVMKLVGTVQVTVKINGNMVVVQGDLAAGTFVEWTALDTSDVNDGTFNRFTLQSLGGGASFDVGGVFFDQGVPISAPVGDKLYVEDDGPGLTAETASIKVAEDLLPGGIPDSDPETDSDTATFTYADLAALIDVGTDEPPSFALNLDPGLDGDAVLDINGDAITSKCDPVVWNINGTTLEGVVGTRVIFTLTHTVGDADDPTDDSFTFDLQDQIDHSDASGNPTGDNGIESIDLTPAFLAMDADSDPADLNGENDDLAPIYADVENDVPAFSAQIVGSTLDQGSKTAVSSSLKGLPGADENPHYTIDYYENLAGYIEETTTDTNGGVIKVSYYVDTDPGAPEVKGALAYTLEVFDTNTIPNPDDNTGMYTFTNYLDPPAGKLEFDFTFFPSGSSMFGILLDNDDQADLTPPNGLLVIGRNVVLDGNGGMVAGTDTINTSAGGGPVTIGVNNQMFDPGEGAVFVYLTDPERNSSATQSKADGLTQNTADDADALGFGGTLETRGGSVEVVQRQGSAPLGMKLTCYDLQDDDAIQAATDPLGGKTKKNLADDKSDEARAWVNNPNGDVLHNATPTTINGIKVFDTGVDTPKAEFTINTSTGVVTIVSNTAGISVVADHTDDGVENYDFVTVVGFQDHDTIAWTTDGDHDSVLVEGYSGAWDVGGFNIEQGIDSPDLDIDFSVAITDFDGDTYDGADTSWDDFTIKLDGTGANNDPNNDPPGTPTLSSFAAPLMLKDPGFVDDSGMRLSMTDDGFIQREYLVM